MSTVQREPGQASPEHNGGPLLTTDLEQAKKDMEAYGYCLVGEVLSSERVAEIRGRLDELAAQEIADGTDYVYENGSNQRIWTLLNKGDMFVDLAVDRTVWKLIAHLLGPAFLLSNIDANIAGPGGPPMFLHADQSYVPPPWPPYAMVANAMWMLDEFKPENGATCVVPRSHLWGFQPGFGTPPEGESTEPVPACAPAGSIMVFDGRLWHQTGANTTEDERRFGILAYYCRPFIRTQESWFLTIDDAVLERRPELRPLLGYENYLSLGMIDGMPRVGPRF
jgi:ectoine hydroxylase-related dioxygenase (phytanoyl-CoA dioxygenase family)